MDKQFYIGWVIGAAIASLAVFAASSGPEMPEYKGHKVRTIKQDSVTYHILLKEDSVVHISHNHGL